MCPKILVMHINITLLNLDLGITVLFILVFSILILLLDIPRKKLPNMMLFYESQ